MARRDQLEDLRYRIILDSAAITATTLGDTNFFTDAGSKTEDRMHPLIDGRLPAGESMLVERMSFWVGERVEVQDVADSIALTGTNLRLVINDGAGDPLKIRAPSFKFPAGGGPAAGVTTTADLALEGQSFSNGVPDRRAMFVWDEDTMPLIKENTAFRVVLNTPAVLTGLTNMRAFVSLEGYYKYALASA